MNLSAFRGYWNLDEASGDAVDATGRGHTLTETSGTIASAEGGRDFEWTETEYFTKGSHADYSFGDVAFTIGAWVKLESQASIGVFVNKNNYGINNREYKLLYNNSTDRYNFNISPDGKATSVAVANNYGAVPDTTQNFVVAWHDPTADKIYIQVDNGTPDETAHATGCYSGSAAFSLGCDFNGGAAVSYFDGIMWSAFVYAGVMTADERTAMYNGGTPLKWADIVKLPKTYRTPHGINLLGRHGRRLVF